MSVGRKPKPTHLKAVAGNPGKRPLPENEPKPPAADPTKMPRGMTAGAQRHWPKLAKILSDAGVLSDMDVEALRMYCEAKSRWTKANNRVQQEGILASSPSGRGLVAHPAIAISNAAFAQMKSLLCEFGMTPSSRTRVTMNTLPPEPDDWDAL